MATKSGRIHDPNAILQDYDLYFNDQIVSTGYDAYQETIGMITRQGTTVTIPEGVTRIGASAFRNMGSMTKLIIPDTVTEIGNYAISSCNAITEIYIPASVTTINANTFTADNNLTVIKCGFSSGDVSGAPWGATNAVVTYDEDRPEGL